VSALRDMREAKRAEEDAYRDYEAAKVRYWEAKRAREAAMERWADTDAAVTSSVRDDLLRTAFVMAVESP
jgi:hypothetical protein